MSKESGRELAELFAALDLLAQRWLDWRGSGSSEDTVSVAEAAAHLGIPVRTLREWIGAGAVPVIEPIPPARGRRISVSALEELRKIRRRSPSRGTALPRI
jgi:excisionase family DNA binding protein